MLHTVSVLLSDECALVEASMCIRRSKVSNSNAVYGPESEVFPCAFSVCVFSDNGVWAQWLSALPLLCIAQCSCCAVSR